MAKMTPIKVLGKRIKAVDSMLVHLLARRIRISEEVAMIKIQEKGAIYNPTRETSRLNGVARIAKKIGLNPDFVKSVLYGIIDESCKRQMVIADRWRLHKKYEKFNPTYREKRANLLQLTKENAETYADYGMNNAATKALIEYERKLIDSTILKLDKCEGTMLEVGCATGREMRRLCKQFSSLEGLDISKDMVDKGNSINQERKISNVRLRVHDIEEAWPVKTGSVSFLLMNLGTGSDIRNLKFVLREVKRVLADNGRFVLSFYNKKAWTQQIFFPWPLGSVAGIDQDRSCLEVFSGGEYRAVYAKPYSVQEVTDLIKPILRLDGKPQTYPTLFSILPTEIIKRMGKSKVLPKIDAKLASHSSNLGSYIIVSGGKK